MKKKQKKLIMMAVLEGTCYRKNKNCYWEGCVCVFVGGMLRIMTLDDNNDDKIYISF